MWVDGGLPCRWACGGRRSRGGGNNSRDIGKGERDDWLMARDARPGLTTVAGWVAFAVSCVWVVVGVVIRDFSAPDPADPFVDVTTANLKFAATALFVVTFTGLGALVLSREPRNSAALLCLVPVLIPISHAFASVAGVEPGSTMVELSGLLREFVWSVPLTMLLLLMPNGHLPDRRWRPFARLLGISLVVSPGLSAAGLLLSETSWAQRSPLQLTLGWAPPVDMWWIVAFGSEFVVRAGMWVAPMSLVHRLLLTRGRERAQVAWVLLGAGIMELAVGFPGLMLLRMFDPYGRTHTLGDPAVVVPLGALAFPVACGVAILRYRLVELNPLLRRLLLAVILVTVLTGCYLGLRALFGAEPLPATVTAVGLAMVTPVLYRWLRGGVTRLVYGRRGSPADITAALTRRMATASGPDEVLAVLADSVCYAVPGAVGVVLTSGSRELRRVFRGAEGVAAVREKVPLTFQGVELGYLEIAPRCTCTLDVADRALLGDLAAAAAAAVAAAHRSAQLQRAHQELITAREQERRRIARDLHDGVGPVLSGLGFTLDSLRAAVRDPDAARVAGQARGQVRDAMQLVRRVARELRPAGVDQLGLVGALRELAARHTGGALTVELTAGDLGELCAATEVAAHAIVAEALTNAARHAAATRCDMTLDRVADGLDITVQDNGVGLGGAPAGVGRASMIERAEELGGWCRITTGPGGGTGVQAHLPVRAPGPALTDRAPAGVTVGRAAS